MKATKSKLWGGEVVFVDADPFIRYQRLLSRSKPGEITKTFEEFAAFDLSEETEIIIIRKIYKQLNLWLIILSITLLISLLSIDS